MSEIFNRRDNKKGMMNLKILEYLIYALLGALVLWAILKAVGIINTPAFIESIPQFITAGVISLMFHYLREDIKELRERLNSHIEKRGAH